MPYCYLGTLWTLSAHCIRSISRIFLLKLKSACIRHMVLRFDVRNPFIFFSRITFMDFSNPLVHILFCRVHGKRRLQNMKGRATMNMI